MTAEDRIQRGLAGLAIAGLVTVAGLLGIEGGARWYLMHLAPDATFVRYASLAQLTARHAGELPKYSPHRYLGYYPTPNYRHGSNRHNALGYRGDEIPQPKPAGERRVVCLGGSTTYSFAIEDYHLSYPARLEHALADRGYRSVRVINAGADAYTSWESLINFEFRILDLEPDLIVVYDAYNDIHARLVWPPAAYRGDNSGRRAPLVPAALMPSLAEHSTVLRALMIAAGWSEPQASLAWSIDHDPDTYQAEAFRRQWAAGTYPSGVFREASARQMLETNGPKYFARNLENLAVLARHHHVQVLLLTFAYSPAFPDEPTVASSEYHRAIAEMNDSIRGIAARVGVALFDFAAVFPPDAAYFVDGRHVNPAGAQLKAQLIAAAIDEHALLPKRAHGST